ncbi:MAG: hypothetical protein V3V40_06420 [Nitrosomonadaceae bacterium]
MDTESLDTKIRAKARKQLRDEIKSVALKFKRAIGFEHSGGSVRVKAINNSYATVYVRSAIDIFVDEAVKKQAPKVENSAVEEFLNQLGSMQDQIDELNNG